MVRRIACSILLGCVPLFGAVVNVDRLNVRTAPSPEAMIVATLSAGTHLDSVPENEAWAEIPAPESVPVWVASVFVDENGVLRSGARLRCGPGTVFAEYRRGKNSFREKIVVLDKAHNGFWLRIRPIPGLKCYVNRKFLKEKPSAEKKAKPVRKTVEKQYYVTGDERPVSVEGKLVPLKKNVMDSSYELILEINGEVIPVCYLTASRLNLKLWEKRTVRIDGIQRWVKGIRRPFVEIEKVSPSWK